MHLIHRDEGGPLHCPCGCRALYENICDLLYHVHEVEGKWYREGILKRKRSKEDVPSGDEGKGEPSRKRVATIGDCSDYEGSSTDSEECDKEYGHLYKHFLKEWATMLETWEQGGRDEDGDGRESGCDDD